jgi:HPt (histidine-containing phosphotransfer) domain-containing protein
MNTQSNWSNAAAPRSDTSDSCDASHDVLSCGQAAGLSSSEVLNLEELRNRCMGNIQLVQRVLEKFQQRLPEELAALENALDLNDTEQVARVAHRVKGTSASVSAKGLAQAAAEIENTSRAGCATDIPGRIEHLRDEWEKYLDYAVTLLSASK